MKNIDKNFCFVMDKDNIIHFNELIKNGFSFQSFIANGFSFQNLEDIHDEYLGLYNYFQDIGYNIYDDIPMGEYVDTLTAYIKIEDTWYKALYEYKIGTDEGQEVDDEFYYISYIKDIKLTPVDYDIVPSQKYTVEFCTNDETLVKEIMLFIKNKVGDLNESK